MSLSLNFVGEKSEFLHRWNRLFGTRSTVLRDAIEKLSARRDDAEVQATFRYWLSIWRTTSSAPIENDENAATDTEIESFVLQTIVAQSFFAILDNIFHFSNAERRELFGATPFDWGDELSDDREFASAAREVAPFAATEFAPFGECYSRLFSAKTRRTLGEFYTPIPLADYLRDRAFEIWRQRSREEPSVLDPTCGGGVFLSSVLRARLQQNADRSTVLNGIAGFDASPFAVLTARANLICSATSGVPTSEKPNAFRKIAETRRSTRPNEPILPILTLDSIQNRVPTPLVSPKTVEATRNAPSDFDCPDYFDGRRWADSPDFSRRFDVVLGNPPWIAWDKTASEYRDATKRYWLEYGLFSLSGKEARLGGGKKELASLLVAATVDRRLEPNGVLAFVLPKSLFQTRKAGDGFRRFGWSGTDFCVLQIDDFSEIDVFANVLSKVATFCVRKGEKTTFPIPARRWKAAPGDTATKKPFRGVAVAEPGRAFPTSERPGAPLIFEFKSEKTINFPVPAIRANADDAADRRDALAERILTANENDYRAQKKENITKNGVPSDYVAQLGANAAGASGVFWLEKVESFAEPFVLLRNLGDVGKKKVETRTARVESALVFPLLRWRDVDEFFAAEPSTAILLPQDLKTRRGIDETTMRRDFPAAFEYLSHFENALKNRAAFRKFQRGAPFWSLYNVDASTFAPIKVVWRRIDCVLRAAVVAPEENAASFRPIIPQETLSTVAISSLDEADYLAAVLNSTPIRRRVAATSVPGSKSFGSPGILETLGIPRFDADEADRRELAERGRDERLKRRDAFQKINERR